MTTESVYKQHGFEDRKEYLDSLSEEYGREEVYALAHLLGESEDFDGLLTSLEDTVSYW